MKDSKVIPDPSLLNSRLCSRLGLEKTTQCPELAWPQLTVCFTGANSQHGYRGSGALCGKRPQQRHLLNAPGRL